MSTYITGLNARTQRMSYETLIISTAIYIDIPTEKSLDCKRIAAASIKKRFTDPYFARSVQDIANNSAFKLDLVDSNDIDWMTAVQAAGPIAGNPLPVTNANAYTGGNTDLMAPVGNINWTKNFDGMEFSQISSPNLNQNPVESIESRMEKYTKSNYEDFVIAAWLKQEHPDKSDKEKLARMYVMKNIARDADKSVLDVLKLQSDEIALPYQLDQDWNNNNILTNNVIGNYDIKELPDINGIDGDIQLEGKLKKAILIAGILFLSIDPNSYPAKIIGV